MTQIFLKNLFGDSNYNKLKQLIKNTDGRSTNRPKPTPKNFETFRQGNLFGGSSETSTNPKNQGFKPNPNKGTKVAAYVNKIKTKNLHQLICETKIIHKQTCSFT